MFRRFRRRSSGGESADVLIMAAHMSLASGNTAIAGRALAEAEQMIHTYEANGQLSLLTSAIDTLRSLLDDNGLLDPFSRHHARHALGTALWSLFERTGDLAALDESAALLKSAAEAAGVPGGSARSPARCA
jgi:hypothetical protein